MVCEQTFTVQVQSSRLDNKRTYEAVIWLMTIHELTHFVNSKGCPVDTGPDNEYVNENSTGVDQGLITVPSPDPILNIF